MDDHRAPSSASRLRLSWMHWLGIDPPPPGTAWARLGWTFVFCAGIAAGYTLLFFTMNARTLADWLSPRLWFVMYARNLGISLVIGYVIQGLFTGLFKGLGPSRTGTLPGWARAALFMLVPLAGTAIGWPVGVALVFLDVRTVTRMPPAELLGSLVLSLMISSLFLVWYTGRLREAVARRRAADAQLRLLQGQMEPHFLFNTLANVVSLIDADAPRAKRMLEAFTDYLRASLGSLRRDESTLDAELELATRFLLVMQARMGERLRFELDVEPALRRAPLPPLLLQPLVENAVKHGLEPQVDGGTVRVSACRAEVDGQPVLRLVVDDDGIGLAAAAARPRRRVGAGSDANGIALDNLRARLASSFGAAGRLTLAPRTDAPGTRACLELRWRGAAG
jgi:signal transduction histidine kinase